MTDPQLIVAALYGWSGPLMSLAYLPQIRVLWRARDSVADTSLLTWFMWALGLAITTAYAALVNRDLVFVISSASNLSACLIVFGLAVYKRWRYAPA